ncbi:acetate kinase [Clostridium homopropionicum DSM 5847]|uniref:Acetate kinase n=1 Tax=Clostridium homopropionicum DSM 5847 TaxID=1121318 RepID=A0A0L6ZAK6_9CLOT|nr:acetate kinase [Clostridium homopropionicum]KOA20009.1 acetate kinase [Clostridium homopropionicum DSM 5847]SFG64619.1 acetate kinase [Clostridium homopropionicum]
MKILVLNCGSSSIKFQVAEMPEYEVLAKGSIGRIGYEDSEFKYSGKGLDEKLVICPILNHEEGINLILKTLFDPTTGMNIKLEDISAIGHRVVQGGDKNSISLVIDDTVINNIEEIKDLAPLHNPNHLAGIYACRKLLPNVPQVAVFDNGFHSTLPKSTYLYGLPYEYYEKYKIRRYGFHGIAFRSMAEGVKKLLNRPFTEFKIVNMMLGSGTTANAVLYGKSMEVSTGFTPHEGLIQSTRAGDLDAAALLYLMKKESLSVDQIDDLINKKSGWKGLSGINNDMREIYNSANEGNERAKITIDTVCHRFKKYIGAYAAILEGIDLLVFSGGVGENAWYIREKVCKGLEFIGIDLDKDKNKALKGAGIISKENSKVKILVTYANEEKIIAEDTFELISK